MMVVLCCTRLGAQEPIQLAAPIPNSTRSVLTPAGNPLCIDFRMQGALVRYSSGEQAPTATSPVFNKDTLWVRTPQKLKFRSFHPDFLPSEAVEVVCIAAGIPIDTIVVNPPNPQYSANGPKTLCDQILADRTYKKNCLGYSGEKIDIRLQLKETSKVHQVRISTVTSQSAWIFGPAKISIFDDNGILLGEKKFPKAGVETADKYGVLSVPIKPVRLKQLHIIVEPLQQLPKWHPGFPAKPWLFVDEVLVD